MNQDQSQGEQKKVTRPDVVKDEHLKYLDELRDSAKVNMLGARPYSDSQLKASTSTMTNIPSASSTV